MIMDNSNEKKRKEIIEKISDIKTMRKGVVSAYYVNTKLKNGSIKENGPYYVLTSKAAKGKTIGEKIPDELVDSLKTETDNYKLFRDLSDEYISVCEQAAIESTKQLDETDKLKKTRN